MDEVQFVWRTINGVDHKFLTPKYDYGCFDFIVRDWIDYAPRWSEFIDNFDVAIQAGGNCGVYPYLLGRKFNHVYTFECDPYSFYCLATNLKSPKFIKFNCALGDETKQQRMVSVQPYGPDRLSNNDGIKNRLVDGKPIFNTGQSQVGKGPITIHQITIDSLNVHACDLIFLDIEGYEATALKGAVKTINKFKPTVIVEASNKDHHDVLRKLKYELRVEFGDKPPNEIWTHDGSKK